MLPSEYDVATALDGLVDSVTDVLGLAGAGGTLEMQGRLRLATAHSDTIGINCGRPCNLGS